jgi:hypothetical protein
VALGLTVLEFGLGIVTKVDNGGRIRLVATHAKTSIKAAQADMNPMNDASCAPLFFRSSMLPTKKKSAFSARRIIMKDLTASLVGIKNKAKKVARAL